jgi:CBS domain-containing protein
MRRNIGVTRTLQLGNVAVAAKTLKELGLAQQNVVTINAEAQTFAALSLMNDNGLSSLPIVDHGGHLLGNISLTDVRL